MYKGLKFYVDFKLILDYDIRSYLNRFNNCILTIVINGIVSTNCVKLLNNLIYK